MEELIRIVNIHKYPMRTRNDRQVPFLRSDYTEGRSTLHTTIQSEEWSDVDSRTETGSPRSVQVREDGSHSESECFMKLEGFGKGINLWSGDTQTGSGFIGVLSILDAKFLLSEQGQYELSEAVKRAEKMYREQTLVRIKDMEGEIAKMKASVS